MPLDRFVPRIVKYELKQSQMFLELVISSSLMRMVYFCLLLKLNLCKTKFS